MPSRNTLFLSDQLAVARWELDIKAITESAQFAHRVRLARDVGLLELVLAGDSVAAAERASELLLAPFSSRPPGVG